MRALSSKIMRSIAIAAVAGAASIAMSVPASAVTVSSTSLQTFGQVGASGAGIVAFRTGQNADATMFSAIFLEPVSGSSWAAVGGAGLAISYAAGDSLELWVTNTNESPWDFQLIADTFQSVVETIAVGATKLLTVALNPAGGTINSVSVQVSGNIPIAGFDRNAEFELAAVPLPAGVALLGGGLLVLGAVSRMRRKVPAGAVMA